MGFDENGTARHAHKRGTYSNAAGYRGNVEGSDPKYSFNHIGTSDTLYVFEAPIDMLSYISLHQRGWQQHSYVTLDGVAEHALLQVLSQNNNYLFNVVMCLDHDAAGIEATGRLAEILREKGYDRISCLQSAFKDWNEDLKAQYRVTPILAQENPKIEACRDRCKELRDLCNSVKSIRSSYERLMEHYGKFRSLVQNGKVMVGREAVVMEQLQSMAAFALLAIQEQYRQLEKPVRIEQLTKELYESYHPHQDKGKLRVKADDLQQEIASIKDQLQTVGIRTLDDKQKLISSYMSLALNCVNAHIFIDREGQEQKITMQQKPNLDQTDGEQVIGEETSKPQYNLL